MEGAQVYLRVFLVVVLPLMGIIYALLGGIKLALAERLGLDEGRVGRLVSGFGMMVGPTILACGFLADAFGRKGVFFVGAVLVVVALGVLARTRDFRGALIGVLLLGAGWSATVNVANVLMYMAADPEHPTAAINFFDFVFGFGAFVTPMVLAVLLGRVGYSKGMLALAALSVLPVAMVLFARTDPGAPPGLSFARLGELFSSRVFWLCSLAFLFYVPLESSVAGWATTLVSRHAPESSGRLAAVALTGFWLCFMGSRLLVSILGIEKGRDLMLLTLSVASVALMLGIVFLPGRSAAVSMVVAAGLIFGPIFPTLMAKVLSTTPDDLKGRAVGFFFAFGSIGWTFIPSLIGNVARRTNIQRGFLVASASSAVFLIFVVVQHFVRKA